MCPKIRDEDSKERRASPDLNKQRAGVNRCFTYSDYFLSTQNLFSPVLAQDREWLMNCGCPLADELRKNFYDHTFQVLV